MTHASDIPSADDTVSSDWDTKSAAQEQLHAELQPLNKTALFEALSAAGVTLVIVSFDGYGDSGQIENVEVKAGDTVVAMPECTIEIAEAVWDQAEEAADDGLGGRGGHHGEPPGHRSGRPGPLRLRALPPRDERRVPATRS